MIITFENWVSDLIIIFLDIWFKIYVKKANHIHTTAKTKDRNIGICLSLTNIKGIQYGIDLDIRFLLGLRVIMRQYNLWITWDRLDEILNQTLIQLAMLNTRN